jgi:hypothetical protein
VGVDVAVGDIVDVGVAVNADDVVEVADGTKVGVSEVSVDEGFVFVGFGFGVDDGVEGMNTNVLVGLVAITGVLVAEETVVGAGEDVNVPLGNGVPVTIDTPGVRKLSIQTGAVRMEASTGSMNPLGLRVRKALFGLI